MDELNEWLYGSGIGRAIAVKLAELGAKVYGISRTQADLDGLRTQVSLAQVLFFI